MMKRSRRDRSETDRMYACVCFFEIFLLTVSMILRVPVNPCSVRYSSKTGDGTMDVFQEAGMFS